MDRIIKVSSSALISASQQERKAFKSYLFAKKLSSLFKHPIILNYQTKAKIIASELGITERSFRDRVGRLMKYGYAHIEGDHLRIYSISRERVEFKSKRDSYFEILESDLESVFHLEAINHCKQSQERALKNKERKQSCAKNRRADSGVSDRVRKSLPHIRFWKNSEVTLSARIAARIFCYSSTRSAQVILEDMERAGHIQLADNITKLDLEQFIKLKQLPGVGKNLRFDKNSGSCSFIGAKIISKIDKFYLKRDYQEKLRGIKGIDSKKLSSSYYSSSFFLNNF